MDKDGARLELWGIALRAWEEKPLLGQGPGTFESSYRRLRPERLVEFYSGPGIMQGHSHNGPLEVLSSLGVLGALAATYLAHQLRAAGDREIAALACLIGGAVNALVNPFPVEGLCVAGFLLGVLSRGEEEVRGSRWLGGGAALASLALSLAYLKAEASHPFDANELLPCEAQYAADVAEELPKWLNEFPQKRPQLLAHGREVADKLSSCRPNFAPARATAGALEWYGHRLGDRQATALGRAHLQRAVELDPLQAPFKKLLAGFGS